MCVGRGVMFCVFIIFFLFWFNSRMCLLMKMLLCDFLLFCCVNLLHFLSKILFFYKILTRMNNIGRFSDYLSKEIGRFYLHSWNKINYMYLILFYCEMLCISEFEDSGMKQGWITSDIGIPMTSMLGQLS